MQVELTTSVCVALHTAFSQLGVDYLRLVLGCFGSPGPKAVVVAVQRAFNLVSEIDAFSQESLVRLSP